MMKFCKDCKWSTGSPEFMKCDHPKNRITSLVTGEKEYKIFPYCSTQRIKDSCIFSIWNGKCGEIGRRFEKKNELAVSYSEGYKDLYTIWKKIKDMFRHE